MFKKKCPVSVVDSDGNFCDFDILDARKCGKTKAGEGVLTRFGNQAARFWEHQIHWFFKARGNNFSLAKNVWCAPWLPKVRFGHRSIKIAWFFKLRGTYPCQQLKPDIAWKSVFKNVWQGCERRSEEGKEEEAARKEGEGGAGGPGAEPPAKKSFFGVF